MHADLSTFVWLTTVYIICFTATVPRGNQFCVSAKKNNLFTLLISARSLTTQKERIVAFS
jgi:hypothetical protein